VAAMPELIHLFPNNLRKRIKELEQELADARERIKVLEAKLETDPLLNILNRRGFERELKNAIVYTNRYHSNVALLTIVVSNLKAINDRYGHLAGEAVLMAAADAISREQRSSDIVARIGSDAFAVLCWNLSDADAAAKARLMEKIVGALEVPFDKDALCIACLSGHTMLKRFDSHENVLARAEADIDLRRRQRLQAA
jgi:diguanylate cyclase (GGDEF)-like protein